MRKAILVSFVSTLLLSVMAFAQYTSKQDDAKQDEMKAAAQDQKATSHKTVTGCLQKGNEPGEFSITGEDGKTWGLRSSRVKLDEHVGHTVTITGSPARESKAEEKKEGQVEKASGKQEYGDLRVTTLKMVSQTCSK